MRNVVLIPFSAKAYQLLLWRLTSCNYFCKVENNLIKHLHNNFIKGSYYNRNPMGYDNNGNITSSATKRELTTKQKFQLWYTKQIYRLSASNSDVYIRLVRVMNLIRSPFHLFIRKCYLYYLIESNSRNIID